MKRVKKVYFFSRIYVYIAIMADDLLVQAGSLYTEEYNKEYSNEFYKILNEVNEVGYKPNQLTIDLTRTGRS